MQGCNTLLVDLPTPKRCREHPRKLMKLLQIHYRQGHAIQPWGSGSQQLTVSLQQPKAYRHNV
jgi:hypothetical protein